MKPAFADAQRVLKLLFIFIFMMSITACGGGGGGGGDDSGTNPSPSPTAISGTVTAPGGVIAQLQSKSMLASIFDSLFPAANATLSGTSPVAGANVELVRVDTNNKQIEVIDSTTTGPNGEFSFDTDEVPASTLVIVVDSGSAVMRAIVAEPVIEVNPTTEYVLRQIEGALLANPALDLSDFTVGEIQSMVDAVDLIPIDVSGVTLSDAINTIATQADTTMDSEISIASIDLTGSWYYYETVGPNTCGDPVGMVWAEYPITIEQQGNQLTVNFQDPDGTIVHTGQLDGLEITGMPLDTYPEFEGTTTVTAQTYNVDPGGDYIAASYDWTWTRTVDNFTCSGTDYAAINRIVN